MWGVEVICCFVFFVECLVYDVFKDVIYVGIVEVFWV